MTPGEEIVLGVMAGCLVGMFLGAAWVTVLQWSARPQPHTRRHAAVMAPVDLGVEEYRVPLGELEGDGLLPEALRRP